MLNKKPFADVGVVKTLTGSIAAAIMISIGGSVFLACPDNRYWGAILFSVALLTICYLGFYLYTGKIGYLVADHSPANGARLLVGLFGNLAVTFPVGMLIRKMIPNLGERAATICQAKLEQSFGSTFVRAIFCGVLMYIAVEIFREKKSPIGVLFGIPVFILAGFEHSIADMFYFGASGIVSGKIASFEVAAVLGNSVGSVILPLLALLGSLTAKKKDQAQEKSETPAKGGESNEG